VLKEPRRFRGEVKVGRTCERGTKTLPVAKGAGRHRGKEQEEKKKSVARGPRAARPFEIFSAFDSKEPQGISSCFDSRARVPTAEMRSGQSLQPQHTSLPGRKNAAVVENPQGRSRKIREFPPETPNDSKSAKFGGNVSADVTHIVQSIPAKSGRPSAPAACGTPYTAAHWSIRTCSS